MTNSVLGHAEWHGQSVRPHKPGLAESGVRFEQAFCQSPPCTPSRASFLMGYPRTTRCRQNGQSIPDDEVLVTRLLAEAGYTLRAGRAACVSACHPSVCPARERRINDGYHEFHWSHHPGGDWPTADYNHSLRERGVTYKRTPFEGSRHVQTGPPAEHHQTTWCAQKAINFIEANAAATRKRPWLFSVNLPGPASSLRPRRKTISGAILTAWTISRSPTTCRANWTMLRIPADGSRAWRQGGLSVRGHDRARPSRAPPTSLCGDLIDEQVGRMLDCDGCDNTLVIFMSDHGEMLGDHGIYLKGPFSTNRPSASRSFSWRGVLALNRRSRARAGRA